MSKAKTYFWLFFFTWSSYSIFCQNKTIDSLKQRLMQGVDDTAMVSIYNKLSWQYVVVGYPDTVLQYCIKGVNLSENLLSASPSSAKTFCIKKNLGKIYNNLGIGYKSKSLFDSALIYFFKSLEVYDETELAFPKYHNEIEGMRSKSDRKSV